MSPSIPSSVTRRLFLVILIPLCAQAMACGGDDPEQDPEANNTSAQAFTLQSSEPADGATAVALDAAIHLRLTQEIDAESVTAQTFYVNPSVDGVTSYEDEGKTLVFTPSVNWQPSTTYKVTLEGKVTTTAGDALGEEVEVRFSTAATPPVSSSQTYEANGETVEIQLNGDPGARSYTMTTTATLRDNLPADKTITIAEQPGDPYVTSGSDLFDGLFAMALEETRQNSVEQISDGAFNNGNGVPCPCFETGAKWNYVWTRDTAYAVDLGLAIIDPTRAKNSLDFKLSSRKAGDGLQIVQDTGTGGSWPVSTDRVVWSIGAWELLKYLDGAERTEWRDRVLTAMTNTIAQDRRAVYDPEVGLYRGEQSFLDWREQSYPRWTAENTVHIGMSYALSTNVGHWFILHVAAQLAMESGDMADAARWEGWRDDLGAAIRERLWLDDAGMFSTFMTTHLDPAPIHKYDLLGESLAVLAGVATDDQAQRVVASYPRVPQGPAVMWPQQPLIPIYHNRGIWPFVTAYGLLAARKVGNAAVFEHDLASLIRGAALNLSNMENFEFTTLAPYYDDGEYSGPVVNSRRQLWSVAGYIGAIVKGVFGMEATQSGVRFAPFITPSMQAQWFADQSSITLHGISWRGHSFDVTVALPADAPAEGGAYAIDRVTLNGDEVDAEAFWSAADLDDANTVEVVLGTPQARGEMTLVEDLEDFKKLWAPRQPNLTEVAPTQDGSTLELTFDGGEEQGVVFHIWRDGTEVATDLEAGTWVDPDAADWETTTHCYVVEAKFPETGHRSQHTPPQCWWGNPGDERIDEVSIHNFRAIDGGEWSTQHGRAHYQNWGEPSHALELSYFTPQWSGEHLLQLVYGNGAGGFNTGITSAVKEIVVEEAATGDEVARGTALMPHLGFDNWARWGESSFVRADLDATKVYRVRVEDGINMSYFAHFIPYTAGNGGGMSPYNRVNIHALKVLPMAGQPDQTPPAVTLEGDNDLDAYDAAQVMTPGATLNDWSRYGISWDEDAVYVTLLSSAFEDPYKPLMIYVEALDEPAAPAQPSQGTEYSGLTPELAFTPDFLVGARRLSDDGSAEGPYNGVWRYDSGAWERVMRLAPEQQWWVSEDQHTLSVAIPRALFEGATTLRMSAHVVNAGVGNEWKEVVPQDHTPWMASGAGYLTLDLSAPPALP